MPFSLVLRCGIAYNTNVDLPRVVLDTNILVSALRSKNGAAFKLLLMVGTGRFEIALSVPLVLEYEDAMLRKESGISLNAAGIERLLDYLCASAIRQDIFFLWRPRLPDPKDDLLLEVAVAAGCKNVITYNKRDFLGAEQFGIKVLTPAEFLREIGEIT